MSDIAIVYFSTTGTTAALAEAVTSGAKERLPVKVHRISGDDIVAGRFKNDAVLEAVDNAGGVIFGSPTYMGGPAAQFKAFADASSDRWTERRWIDKIAAGFTTGSCPNGDQSLTLIYFATLAAQHGMLWCNLDIPSGYDDLGRNRLGSQSGVVSRLEDGALPASDLETARYLGHRVANLVLKMRSA